MVAVGQGCIVALAARFCLSPPLCRQPQSADGGHGLLRAGTWQDQALHLPVLLDPAAGLSRVFSFTVPAVILSGYIPPVENMRCSSGWRPSTPSPTSSCCSGGLPPRGLGWSAAWPCSGRCSPSPASPCRWRSPCSAAISPDAHLVQLMPDDRSPVPDRPFPPEVFTPRVNQAFPPPTSPS